MKEFSKLNDEERKFILENLEKYSGLAETDLVEMTDIKVSITLSNQAIYKLLRDIYFRLEDVEKKP